MLVLTRRRDESIMIGDNIKITVVDDGMYSGKVRIGIAAPDEVIVHREEVYLAIQRNGKPGKLNGNG